MKINLSYLAGTALIFAVWGCHSDKQADKKDTATTTTITSTKIDRQQSIAEDSLLLTDIVKKLYKWHVKQKLTFDGFKPVKLNATDTLYKGIDLRKNQKSVDELKGTGLFTDNFLKQYRNIALRMDKELREGSSVWPDGDLPSFNDDADPWCNCQDSPVDDYWLIIKLTGIQINNNQAQFAWKWNSDTESQPYRIIAVKENGNWVIDYMQGFDMKYYNWGAGKSKSKIKIIK